MFNERCVPYAWRRAGAAPVPIPGETARLRNCDMSRTFGNVPEYGYKEGWKGAGAASRADTSAPPTLRAQAPPHGPETAWRVGSAAALPRVRRQAPRPVP